MNKSEQVWARRLLAADLTADKFDTDQAVPAINQTQTDAAGQVDAEHSQFRAGPVEVVPTEAAATNESLSIVHQPEDPPTIRDAQTEENNRQVVRSDEAISQVEPKKYDPAHESDSLEPVHLRPRRNKRPRGTALLPTKKRAKN